MHFSFHLFVFLDYRLLSFFRTVLEKWEGEGKRGEERGGNKAPQSQRDSLSLSGFNLLIRSSRTHRTLHLNNTSYPSPPLHPSHPQFCLPSQALFLLLLAVKLQKITGENWASACSHSVTLFLYCFENQTLGGKIVGNTQMNTSIYANILVI